MLRCGLPLSDSLSEIALLVPTCRKFEPYLPLFLDLIERHWPEHPELWVVSDGEGAPGVPLLRAESPEWMPCMREALRQLRAARPNVRFVFLLLEDLAPLHRVQADVLHGALAAAVERDLPETVFRTFRFFHFLRSPKPPEEWGGSRFYEVDPQWRYYSQLQPSLWRLDHLFETLEAGLALGKRSVWEFEFLNIGGPHYVHHYRWPSLINGVFLGGLVNPKSLLRLPFGGPHRALVGEMWRRAAREQPRLYKTRVVGFVQRRWRRVVG